MGSSTNAVGYSVFLDDDLDQAAVQVKASAGMFFGGAVYNSNATVRYLHVYNSTDGSGSIIYTQPLKGSTVSLFEIGGGIKLTTAISVEVTTAFDGTGNPGADDIDACLFYV